jgi:hypothetical protein
MTITNITFLPVSLAENSSDSVNLATFTDSNTGDTIATFRH